MPYILHSLLLVGGAYLLGSLSGRRLWARPPAGDTHAEAAVAAPPGGRRREAAGFAFDLGKGAVAAWVGLHLAPASAPYADPTAHAYAAALAAALGHALPVWHRFRGTVAVAPLAGAIAVLWPWVLPALLAAWGASLLASGSPLLASATAALVLAAAALWTGAAAPRLAFAIAAAVLVVGGQRVALLRVVRGEAPRFAAARLLLRLRRGPR